MDSAVAAGHAVLNAVSADQFGDFTYTDNGTTITIIGYTGAGGAVDIPASSVIDTVISPVTIIGAAASSGLTSLASVTDHPALVAEARTAIEFTSPSAIEGG
jgi:hypothetical protein